MSTSGIPRLQAWGGHQAAKAGPAAARGYADGWNARRAHEEGPR